MINKEVQRRQTEAGFFIWTITSIQPILSHPLPSLLMLSLMIFLQTVLFPGNWSHTSSEPALNQLRTESEKGLFLPAMDIFLGKTFSFIWQYISNNRSTIKQIVESFRKA